MPTTTPTNLIVTEPVYRQLARLCREQIARGEFKPGDRFPSERDLAETYKVSRATANKVISNLVSENLLTFRPGVGSFVAKDRGLHASLRAMESFTEAVRHAGMQPETEVIDFQTLPASALPVAVREGLGLDPTSQAMVHFASRIRRADDDPVILEHRWIRAEILPGIAAADLAGSFYALLEARFGSPPGGERHTISARALSTEEARLLATKRGAPALVVEGPGNDTNGSPIWYQVLYYRGDRYQLRNEVHPRNRASTTVVEFRQS